MPEIKEPEFVLPFSQMRIGDSLFLSTLKPAEKIYMMDCMAKDAGIRVKCFTVMSDGILGVRAWRIK